MTGERETRRAGAGRPRAPRRAADPGISPRRVLSRSRWWRDAGRSRPLVNLLLVVLSATAVLAAVLGPLLVGAVGQSELERAVTSAGRDAGALVLTTDLGTESSTAPSVETLTRVLAVASGGAGTPLWSPPQVFTETAGNVGWGAAAATATPERLSRVRVPDAGCAGLAVASGRCPARSGELLVSAADAATQGVRPGSKVVVRPPTTVIGGDSLNAVVRVVGTYQPDPVDVTFPRPGTPAGTEAGVTASPVYMTVSQTAELELSVEVTGRLALRDGLRRQDEARVRSSSSAVQAALLQESRTISVGSGLTDLLDQVDSRIRSATILVLVSEVQALGLAVFALSVVLQRVARARTAEWGIGRLRGVPRRRWLASIYLEPALALLLGVPLGVAAGWVTARWSVAAHLRPGTPVEIMRWPVLTAAAAVTAAFLVALAAVSAPSIRRPLVELIGQRSESRRLTRIGAVAQSAVVLLAAAALYELLQGGVLGSGGSSLSLLAPGLFALALAVLAVRLAVGVVRRVTSRAPRSLGALVVARQAARTPSTLDPAVVIAVGVAVVVFATQVLLLSERNQGLRADALTGAGTVLTVEPTDADTLIERVDTADPSGSAAMAVQERAEPDDAGIDRVVAVDAGRFGAVTSWSPTWADVDVGAALRSSTLPPMTLTGTRVEVDVTDVALAAVPADGLGEVPRGRPVLTLTVDTGTRWQAVQLGPLTSSSSRRAAIPCRTGCRVVSLGATSTQQAPYDVSFTVASISTDVQPDAASSEWLREPDRWRTRVGDLISATVDAQAVARSTSAGLRVHAFDRVGGTPALVLPADALDPLPAVVAPRNGSTPFAGIPDTASGRGLDGLPQLIRVAGHAMVLPRSVDLGVLVDLASASKLSDPASSRPVSEVWLAADAPADIERRLTDAGLTITGRELRSATLADLAQQPSTRAAAASVSLGYAALVLAILALVAARAADVSRRRPDWRSLSDAGLPARRVRRLALVEIAVPALLGAGLGLVSGVVASSLAAPRLPLVDLSTAGPPLDLGVAWASVGVIGAVAVAVIVTTAGVAALIETRPERGQPG